MRIHWISLLSLLIWSHAALAQHQAILSAGGLAYRGSMLKEQGAYTSGYLSLSYTRFQVEVGGTQTGIRYRDGSSLRQTEGTLALTLYPRQGSWLRMGVHALQTTDTLTRGGTTYFLSAGAYRFQRWSVGLSAYWSRYPRYESSGLRVWQVEPVVRWSLFELYTNRTLEAVVIPRWIALSQTLSLGKRSFYSLEVRLVHTRGPWQVEAMTWAGEQTFAVRGYGFVVFNLAEKHTGGYALGLQYPVGRPLQVSAYLYVEQFRDIGFDEDVRVLVPEVTVRYTL